VADFFIASFSHSNALDRTLQPVPKSLYNCTSITSNILSVGAIPAVSESNFKTWMYNQGTLACDGTFRISVSGQAIDGF